MQMTNKELSDLFGYFGLFCWFIVMTPQIYTNYKLKNASSLSPAYVFLCMIGNLISCIGAIWGDLILSTILVTGYLAILGNILLLQIYYYHSNNHINIQWKVKESDRNSILFPEYEPIIENDLPANANLANYNQDFDNNNNNNSLNDPHYYGNTSSYIDSSSRPLSYNRPLSYMSQTSYHSINNNNNQQYTDSIRSKRSSIMQRIRPLSIKSSYSYPPIKPLPTENESKYAKLIYLIVVILLFILILNININRIQLPLIPMYQTLGWISSIIFLIGRLPQVYKNYQRKSIEGLSFFMFLISILGNLFYLAAIFSYSMESQYLKLNLPWILGAVMGLFMDAIILFQFFRYGMNHLDLLTNEDY
ncbi:hypothetical protein K502DRAFT_305063 [Neoconidiobolus thromboides FSU 785]|nr:hypothetical protein K502DRAFT_305063 [Neoconidiobolus thromboides FSU 785]